MTTGLPRWFACLVLVFPFIPVLAVAPDNKDIERLIKQLGSDEFDKREAATKALATVGEPALEALRKAAASSEDPEVRLRAGHLVEAIENDLPYLFNGKDLRGWVADGNSTEADWRVESGAIAITGGPPNGWGFLLTKKEYGNFILRLQFQLEEGAKSGIVLRGIPGRRLGTMPYQFKVNLQKPANTGAILWKDDMSSYQLPSKPANLKPAGEWNQLEIELRGQSLRISVNDEVVLNVDLDTFADRLGAQPALKLTSGRIGLQKHTGTARFRNLDIKEIPLDPKKPAPSR